MLPLSFSSLWPTRTPSLTDQKGLGEGAFQPERSLPLKMGSRSAAKTGETKNASMRRAKRLGLLVKFEVRSSNDESMTKFEEPNGRGMFEHWSLIRISSFVTRIFRASFSL